MGTHALRDQPWLIADNDLVRDLAIKDHLLRGQRSSVLYTTENSADAGWRLAELVGAPLGRDSELHPVEIAARHVQEDLCLLDRRPTGWHLDASCVCFPTRWHLREKVDAHIAAVHEPVAGYDPRITDKVDLLFDRLTDHPVWRRNWFLMTDTTLFQPDRPDHETIIPAAGVLRDLYIRSERQTLRRLSENWLVFTIRIQQAPLGEMLTTQQRTTEFRHWVEHVSEDFGARRHLTDPQRAEMLLALA